jgi:hypothetical protein
MCVREVAATTFSRSEKRVIGGSWKLFVAVLVALAAIGDQSAIALPIAPGFAIAIAIPPSPVVTPVIDRPEIRSYQPYSGLQFNFSLDQPVQRGVHQKRPKIIVPRPVEPVIESGPPRAYSVERYAYCADRPGQIEPRDGPYGDTPLGQRTCP